MTLGNHWIHLMLRFFTCKTKLIIILATQRSQSSCVEEMRCLWKGLVEGNGTQTLTGISPPFTVCGTKYVITEHLLRLLLGARPCQRKTCSSILVAVLSLLVTLQMQSLRHRDQREWIALCIPAPSSEKPLSTHILLDQESHFSHRMSLFNGKAWQMSNHVRSAISPLRFRVRMLQRQWARP